MEDSTHLLWLAATIGLVQCNGSAPLADSAEVVGDPDGGSAESSGNGSTAAMGGASQVGGNSVGTLAGGEGGAARGAGGTGGDGGAGASSASGGSSASSSASSSSSSASSSSSSASSSSSSAGAGGGPAGNCVGPTGRCDTIVCGYPISPSGHVLECTPVSYTTNPPHSGYHYPKWTQYMWHFTQPIDRGYYVHSMEHGAVVLAYDCPSGCSADVAALEAILAGVPQDPRCDPPIKAQLVLTPDPLLDQPIAAAAWGWTLRAQCVDTALIEAFIDDHYAHGPEDECADGGNFPPCF